MIIQITPVTSSDLSLQMNLVVISEPLKHPFIPAKFPAENPSLNINEILLQGKIFRGWKHLRMEPQDAKLR